MHKEGNNRITETKYIMPNFYAEKIKQWLELRCWADPEFPKSIVSSIYYDSKNWNYLNEKINSDFLKTKIRLRWYSDFDTKAPLGNGFIEAKFKIGSLREKERIPVNITADRLSKTNLNCPELLAIPQILYTRGIISNVHIYPAILIQYNRFRYIEPITKFRINIDYNINAPLVNHQMLPHNYPLLLPEAVFEMKGDISKLPSGLQQITAFSCKKNSFSKYSRCYEKIIN